MIKKIISTSISSILVVGSLAGCSARDCNPDHPKGGAFLGALGCSLSGGYDKRASILKKRVYLSEENLKLANNRHYQVLLEYQKFMAELTNERARLEAIKLSMEELDREAEEVAFLHDEIIEEEEHYLSSKDKKASTKKKIQSKKKTFAKKIEHYAKKKSKLTKKLIVTKEQEKVVKEKKELLEKKKSTKIITENESIELVKVTSVLVNLKKHNSKALQESQRSTMMVKNLVNSKNRRMRENSNSIREILAGTVSKDTSSPSS